ncbi:MAG: hypothetical protein A2Y97_09535 [Nitrospirae bacterium RBG_13_39_12]|nr:MAG: hypothetical protein A2Y97_09535 [Nitrospirae bacterium RBG_13_39_12]
MLGLGISLGYLITNQIPFDPVKLSWSKIQILYIGVYYIALSIPFFFTGMVVAAAFSSLSERAGLIYGADLLGAGTGAISILYIMTVYGPDKSVFFISLIAFSAAFFAGGKRLKALSLILILFTASMMFFNPYFMNLKMSPYKGLQIALRYPGAEHLKTYFSPFSRVDTFKSPAVRYAPGLSLKYLEELPEQVGFSIDGSEMNAITAYSNRASLTFLRYLPSALPYEVFRRNDVLILDPKGGLQSITAKYYGSSNIYKIENNPLLVKVVRKDFDEFSGRIYSGNTWSGLGRSWLKYSDRDFDVIDIPMTGTVPSGSFGISEDYRFTVEAFKEYLSHLKMEGVLSINMFILPPLRTELRILNTAVRAIRDMGVKNRDIEKHFAAIRSLESICILMKKSPFTADDIEAIKKFSKDRRFDLIYYPGIKEDETNIYIRTPLNEYFTMFKNILNPETHEQFINSYIFDIKPVSDENPFFHYYLKLKNIRAIYKTMGGKWQYFIEEGYILPVVFIQVLLLGIVLMILPAVKTPKTRNKVKNKVKNKVEKKENLNLTSGINLLPYFAFLGLGFMFVEVSLVHKMILPLENPSYALATVLTSILISSGAGSLASYKFRKLSSPALTIFISILTISYSILLPSITDIISPCPLPIKAISVFFIFLPLGFLMGIPFPTGLKLLGEKNKPLIPWAWTINGCMSVLAPILTIMLALVTGFKIVLWLGALAYLMAFVFLKQFIKNQLYNAQR